MSETAASAAALHRPGRSRRRGARRHARSAPATTSSPSTENLLQARARRLHRRASSPSAASGWTAGRAGASARPGHDWCVLELGAPGAVRRLRHRHPPLRRQPPAVRVGRGRLGAARHAARRRCRRMRLDRAARRSRRCGPTRRTCSRRTPRGAGHATCGSTSSPTAASRASASSAASRPTGTAPAELDAETRAHVPPELRRSRGGRRTAGSRSPAPTRSSAR